MEYDKEVAYISEFAVSESKRLAGKRNDIELIIKVYFGTNTDTISIKSIADGSVDTIKALLSTGDVKKFIDQEDLVIAYMCIRAATIFVSIKNKDHDGFITHINHNEKINRIIRNKYGDNATIKALFSRIREVIDQGKITFHE
jgi:hypothetical protein